MSITAIVENDSIKLPLGVHVPDGTEVEITVHDEGFVRAGESAPGWMSDFVGCLDSLPPDAAERHTEYAHDRKRHLS